MITVKCFTFNPYQENTYLLYDDTLECVIFDPGCYTSEERKSLVDFIETNNLKPVRLINTHCHIDHVLGNKFVAEKYDLPLEIHKDELQVLRYAKVMGEYMGIQVEEFEPSRFLTEKDVVRFGNSELKILFTPGHSPASLSFYSEADKIVIAGDVLFQLSIGRTDLPGGDYNTLINSIKTQLMVLDDEVQVFAGHGPSTTVGFERVNNQFLR